MPVPIVTDSRAVQLLNSRLSSHLIPSVVTESGIVTCFSPEQLEKAYAPKVVTVLGISMAVSPEQ